MRVRRMDATMIGMETNNMEIPLHCGSRFAVMTIDPESGLDRDEVKLQAMMLRLPVLNDVPGVPNVKVLTMARMSPEGVTTLYQSHLDFPTDGDSLLDIAIGGVPDHYVVMMETWNTRYPEEAKYSPEMMAQARALQDGEDFAAILGDPDPDPHLVRSAVEIGLQFLTGVEGGVICTRVLITEEEAVHLWGLHDGFVTENPDQIAPNFPLPNYYIFHDDEILEDDGVIMRDVMTEGEARYYNEPPEIFMEEVRPRQDPDGE